METHISFLIVLEKIRKHNGHRTATAHHLHTISLWLSWQMCTQRWFKSACQCHLQDTRLHAPVTSKCWEPVKLTLIHALYAGGYPEDISITQHTLGFRLWFPAHCHSNSLANESTALVLIKTQWLFGKLMVEYSDLLKCQFMLQVAGRSLCHREVGTFKRLSTLFKLF